jgi:hypothetical protein
MHVLHLLLCEMPGLACRWQPGRAGTGIEQLTAKPAGGRSDTLGVGAGPASGRIRSPAIVPAGIAAPNARSAPAVGIALPGPLPRIRTYPASRRQAAGPRAGAWLPGSWEALFKGSGSDLRDLR